MDDDSFFTLSRGLGIIFATSVTRGLYTVYHRLAGRIELL